MNPDINWSEVIKKEARGSNDEDLGEVQEIANGYIIVQRGIINKEKFYIPQNHVERYDGSILRFRISEAELNKYIGESSPPSIEEQYASTTAIDSGGGSGGGIKVEDTDDTTIPLIGEKSDASKNIEIDHTTLTKKPVTETKTVQVPLVHEEVTIEKRPPGSQTKAQPPVTSTENITIPIKKEEIEVTKTSYVTEEVIVKKKPVTETKEITSEHNGTFDENK
ncbi:MAG TPA: YsnF/AvaK domain-containing protein [Candidatus Nitrosocosmicus sp.]